MATPSDPPSSVRVRRLRAGDIPGLLALSRSVYPERMAWREREFRGHLRAFPRGQLVAEDPRTGELLGMAASLIIRRKDFPADADWYTITGEGRFTTHDPEGETLYGAGVLVAPDARGAGVGAALYRAREALLREEGLERIRAGARISGYGAHAHRMSAETYVREVVEERITDPSLSFHLSQGFRALHLIPDYLPEDEASLGWAVEVEWTPEEGAGR